MNTYLHYIIGFIADPALALIMFMVMLSVLDRVCLSRGKVHVKSLARWEDRGSMLRFSLRYDIKMRPFWSEVCYSLVDRENPTTVISGKTRGLDFSQVGANEEFLLFKSDLLKEGRWDLRVKITSTAGRLNPLYSLIPMQQFYSIPVEIVK